MLRRLENTLIQLEYLGNAKGKKICILRGILLSAEEARGRPANQNHNDTHLEFNRREVSFQDLVRSPCVGITRLTFKHAPLASLARKELASASESACPTRGAHARWVGTRRMEALSLCFRPSDVLLCSSFFLSVPQTQDHSLDDACLPLLPESRPPVHYSPRLPRKPPLKKNSPRQQRRDEERG